jgi:hypothetical protein
MLPTPRAVDVEAVNPLIGSPVALVNVSAVGVPKSGVVKTGLVRVLLVSVSVVALPTRVSVAVGRVTVPVLLIEEITGVVSVLLVRVWVAVVVTIGTPSMFTTPAEALARVVSVA